MNPVRNNIETIKEIVARRLDISPPVVTCGATEERAWPPQYVVSDNNTQKP
jgi:hypothetical protein